MIQIQQLLNDKERQKKKVHVKRTNYNIIGKKVSLF